MAVLATFLVHVLCSIVSCDVKMPHPEIAYKSDQEVSASSSAAKSLFSEVLALDPHADTKLGGLEGYIMTTTGGRRIYAFEGIPYAEPPVGFYRLRPAAPKEPWGIVKEAKKPGPECLQLSPAKVFRVVGSEDCLYMNIYSPQVPYVDGKGQQVFFEPFPVIIWIHGGSYYFGSGDEVGPSYLLDKDVILVTFNFRLGVLGFLSTGDFSSPGNYGLKDQALAIKWVYENIHAFGGDPNRIKIFGHSSGAASAHLHLIANKTTQYFQGGASFSGSAFTHWAIKSPEESKRLTDTLAYNVNCNYQYSEAVVDCLRQKNPVELVYAQYKLLEFAPFPVTLFSPVLEQNDLGAYLTKKPDEAYGLQQVTPKPWIFSTTSQEGYLGILFLQSFFTETNLRSKWEELAPIFLDYKYTTHNVTEITNKITKFYFGPNSPLTVSQSRIAAVFGDRLFMPGIHKAIKTHSQVALTYAYVFGFKGKYTLGSLVGKEPSEWGTQHQDDIMYFLNSSSYYAGFRRNDYDELTLSNVMTSLITNFAGKGEPLLTQPNNVNVRIWEPVDPGNIHYLLLNRDIRMIPEPYKKRINFWLYLGQLEPKLIYPLYDL